MLLSRPRSLLVTDPVSYAVSVIDYIEFNVMQSGTIITSVKYDDESISISYEDSGVDYRHQLLTYDADDEGNVGVFQSLFYDEEDEVFKFIADDIKQVLKKK